MSNTQVANSRTHGEPDTIAILSSLMKDPPVTKEQHSQRMAELPVDVLGCMGPRLRGGMGG